MEALAISLALKTQLTTLTMHGNNLANDSMSYIAMVINNIRLTTLNLGYLCA